MVSKWRLRLAGVLVAVPALAGCGDRGAEADAIREAAKQDLASGQDPLIGFLIGVASTTVSPAFYAPRTGSDSAELWLETCVVDPGEFVELILAIAAMPTVDDPGGWGQWNAEQASPAAIKLTKFGSQTYGDGGPDEDLPIVEFAATLIGREGEPRCFEWQLTVEAY